MSANPTALRWSFLPSWRETEIQIVGGGVPIELKSSFVVERNSSAGIVEIREHRFRVGVTNPRTDFAPLVGMRTHCSIPVSKLRAEPSLLVQVASLCLADCLSKGSLVR